MSIARCKLQAILRFQSVFFFYLNNDPDFYLGSQATDVVPRLEYHTMFLLLRQPVRIERSVWARERETRKVAGSTPGGATGSCLLV